MSLSDASDGCPDSGSSNGLGGKSERVRELCDHFLPPPLRSPKARHHLRHRRCRTTTTCCTISLPAIPVPEQKFASDEENVGAGLRELGEFVGSLLQFANAIPGRRRQRATEPSRSGSGLISEEFREKGNDDVVSPRSWERSVIRYSIKTKDMVKKRAPRLCEVIPAAARVNQDVRSRNLCPTCRSIPVYLYVIPLSTF